MGATNTISCVETRRTMYEIFQEHRGVMPEFGFKLYVDFQVRDGVHFKIDESLSIEDLTSFDLKYIEFECQKTEAQATLSEPTLGRKYPWKVLYKDCSFSSDPFTNMDTTGNFCF